MESILEAYGDVSPKSPSCDRTDVVIDDYCSSEDDSIEEDQFTKHAKIDEPVVKKKTIFAHTSYYSDEDERSEEDYSMKDARFDETLLKFYVKNKVKQLKRKLTSSRVDKFKKKKPEITEPTTFTRYSGTYFSSVVKLLTPHQRSVIEKYGAECMLKVEKIDVPLRFVKWIAGKFDTRTSEIQVSKQFIPITKETIHNILELPIGGTELLPDSRAGRSFILSHFNLTCVPQVSFFGNKLNSGEQLSDDDIFICFMSVAFQCFLCRNSSLQPSTEYLHIFRDPNNVMKCDLSKSVYDWLISSIKKFQKATKHAARRQITLGGNHYSLAVAYLDNVEFGLNSLPDVMPQALVWKGSRIRKYAELDKCSGNSFEKSPLKCFSYANKIQIELSCEKVGHRTIPNAEEPQVSFINKLKTLFSLCLNDQQIEKIHEIVQISNNGEANDLQQCYENVVCDVLKTIYLSNQNDKSANTDGVITGNTTHNHSEANFHTPTLKISSNCNASSSTHSFDANLTISRGKLASGKYQQLSKLLNSRDTDNYILEDSHKHIAAQCVNNAFLHELKGRPTNVLNVQVADANIANKATSPSTPVCPIDIIDSQQINSVPPMKKAKTKCNDLSTSNEGLNTMNKVNAHAPILFQQILSDNVNHLQPPLSPIVPTTLSKLFHENQSSKDQPKEFMHRNDSGPPRPQGCIFTKPAPQDNNFQSAFMHQSNSIDLSSPVCRPSQVHLVEDSPEQAILSQDIHITGFRNFDQRCSTLSKQASDAYNKLLLFTNPHKKQTPNTILIESPNQPYIQISQSSQERQPQNNVPTQERPSSIQLEADLKLDIGESGSSSRSNGIFVPRRVTMPGRFTCTPYITQENRYPVSNSERRYYSAMCQIGQHKVWKGYEAVRYDRAYCSFDSLGTLHPFSHVDNYVVLVYCRKLFLDCHPVASRRHCFFSYIGETILRYNGNNGDLVKGAFIGANKALQMWRADQLTFPICIDEHWFVFAVCLKAKYFAFLDSLYTQNSDFHKHLGPILIQNFVKLWDMFVTPHMSHHINFNEFQPIYPAIPRQSNTDDCGIFTMKIMGVWHPRVNLQNVISSDDILNLRIKLANEIYFAKWNSLDKIVVSEFFGDVGM